MVEVSIHLAASPHDVFEIVSDPDTYPAWLVGAKRIRSVDPDFPGPGSSFEHEVGAGPVSAHDESDVEHVEADRRLDLIVRARPWLEAEVTFLVEPDGDGTRLRLQEDPVGPYRALRWLIDPLVRIRNRTSLRRLAAYVQRDGGGITG